MYTRYKLAKSWLPVHSLAQGGRAGEVHVGKALGLARVLVCVQPHSHCAAVTEQGLRCS